MQSARGIEVELVINIILIDKNRVKHVGQIQDADQIQPQPRPSQGERLSGSSENRQENYQPSPDLSARTHS